MGRILIYGFLFIEILFCISQAISFQTRVKDAYAFRMQTVLVSAYTLQGLSFAAMIMVKNDLARYVLFSVCWYAGIVLLANLLRMAAYSLNCNKRLISYLISVIYYFGLLIYFVDSYFGRGVMKVNALTVELPLVSIIQVILHLLLYIIFLFGLIYILTQCVVPDSKKREIHLFHLWSNAFLISVAGILVSIYFLFQFRLNFAGWLVLVAGSLIQTPYIFAYHRKILLTREDYEDVLRTDNVDFVLVCDDEYKVRFLNRRAEIVAQSLKEEFAGRKLADLFMISSKVEEQLLDQNKDGVYSISAIYAPIDRKISLNIKPTYDDFHNLFSATVSVFGIEDVDVNTRAYKISGKKEETPATDAEAIEVEKDLSFAKGARILIVNENAIRGNVFEKLLQPYTMTLSRSLDAKNAIKDIIKNTYDMIFVDNLLTGTTELEFVTKIRELSGAYYKEVPIILCTDAMDADGFNLYADAGFSDYLLKPISAKHLDKILTRWLWKRYEKDETIEVESNAQEENSATDLEALLLDCELYFDRKNKLLYGALLRAIRQQCVILQLEEYETMARNLLVALYLDDTVVLDKTMKSFLDKLRNCLVQSR